MFVPGCRKPKPAFICVMAEPARCGYLTVMSGESPLVTCFVWLEENAEGIVGAAPAGFLPTAFLEVSLPVVPGDPGTSPVDVEIGVVPSGDVIAFSTILEPGMPPPRCFNEEGGWPDLDAVAGAYVASDTVSPEEPGGEFASLDGESLGAAVDLGTGSLSPAPLAPTRPRARGRAPPKASAAQQMETVNTSLALLLSGQTEMAQVFNQRLSALEAPPLPMGGAGRGSGLLDFPLPGGSRMHPPPPPGLSTLLLGEVGGPPPRAAPLPPGGSLIGVPQWPSSLLGMPLPLLSASALPTSSHQPASAEVLGLQARASAAAAAAAAPLTRTPALPRAGYGTLPLGRAPAAPGAPDPMAALLQAMERQTEAIGALVRRGTPQDPVSQSWCDSEDSGGLLRMPGARGASALEGLERNLAQDPQKFSKRIRANRDRRVRGASTSGQPTLSTRSYLVQEVPFNGAVSAAHFLFGMAEVFDMMEHGRWHQAEAHLGMLIVSGEQAAMDNWRWHHASKLTMVPDPPFHALIAVAGSSLSEPVSHLADPSWVATSMAYAKDLAVFKDHSKSMASTRQSKTEKEEPAPKGLGKGGAARKGGAPSKEE